MDLPIDKWWCSIFFVFFVCLPEGTTYNWYTSGQSPVVFTRNVGGSCKISSFVQFSSSFIHHIMIIFTSNIFFALSVTTRWHVFLKCNHLFSDLSLWCLFTLNLINIYPRPVLTHQLLLLGRPKLVLTKTSAKWLDDHSPTWRAMEFVNKSPVTVWKCGNGISSIYSMSATGDFSS